MIPVQIDLSEYREIIKAEGGSDNLTVFGCYTYMRGDVMASGRVTGVKNIYTEWGRRGDEEPLVAIHTIGDVTKCYKFENPKGKVDE